MNYYLSQDGLTLVSDSPGTRHLCIKTDRMQRSTIELEGTDIPLYTNTQEKCKEALLGFLFGYCTDFYDRSPSG